MNLTWTWQVLTIVERWVRRGGWGTRKLQNFIRTQLVMVIWAVPSNPLTLLLPGVSKSRTRDYLTEPLFLQQNVGQKLFWHQRQNVGQKLVPILPKRPLSGTTRTSGDNM